MSLFLSPVCNDQTFDVNGDPLTGGQVETYIAGSSTPAATYTSEAGTVPHSNPIILNSLGYAPSTIWLNSGTACKFVVKDASGVTLRTIDNVRGINDSSVSVSEWVDSGFVPTYISATSFSVPGDQTATLQVGRRLRTTNTAGTRYSGIVTSAFSAGVTTVTILNDSGTLDAGLSAVQYGLISADNTSFPFATFAAASTVAVVDDSATAAALYPLFVGGTASQQAPKTSTSKLKYTPSTGRLEATEFKGAIKADSIDLTSIKATTPQAQAGSDDTTVMTPAKTKNAITAQAMAVSAAAAAGDVGTYSILYSIDNLQRNPGDLVVGSSLRYTALSGFPSAISPPGTWKCMGLSFISSENNARSTIWLRIA